MLDILFEASGFELQFRTVVISVRGVCANSLQFQVKRQKGITKCGRIERKDQGRTALISLVLFSGPSVLSA